MRQELGRGPAGPCDELASAIGALSAQYRLGARAAERAFEGADQRFARLRWQITIAAFAVRPKLKHEIRRRAARLRPRSRPECETAIRQDPQRCAHAFRARARIRS